MHTANLDDSWLSFGDSVEFTDFTLRETNHGNGNASITSMGGFSIFPCLPSTGT